MKHIILTLIFLIPIVTFAQSPWTVNITDYEFSMNITGKIKQNSQSVNQANSYLAAFVNDQCRGVAKATQLESGEYAYFLTIYSNLPQGEALQFKFSDESSEVSILPQDVLFIADRIYGSPDDLFIFADPVEFETTELFNISLENQIGNANIDNIEKTINLVTGNSDLSALKLYFDIPTGAEAIIENETVMSSATVNFLSHVEFTILGVDGHETTWTLVVEGSQTGIYSLDNSKVKVYPTLLNNNCFYVKTNEKLRYKVMALDGKIIQEGQINAGKQTIYLQDTSKEIYILWLSNAKEHFITKLYKQ